MFAINTRVQFVDGQRGVVTDVYNSGLLYRVRTDNGAHFTARADEIAPIGQVPRAKPVDMSHGRPRTVFLMERGTKVVRCALCAAHYGDDGVCDHGKPVNSPHRQGR